MPAFYGQFAFCRVWTSGSVHICHEFLLKQVEMKRVNNADGFQDDFKGCLF